MAPVRGEGSRRGSRLRSRVAPAAAGRVEQRVVVGSMAAAPVLVLLADVVGRVVAPPGEMPVGIVTAFVGAPVLIALVRRI
nr:iron chelate uptake ABC transporter family permease subunit [Clavibacter michiganensis]